MPETVAAGDAASTEAAMNSLVLALGSGAAVFAIIKAFFALLGWFSRDGSDVVYRTHLDRLWDALHHKSLFQIVHGFFCRLVERSRATIVSPWMWLLVFLGLSGLLNYLLFWCVSMWLDETGLPGKEMGVSREGLLKPLASRELQWVAVRLSVLGAGLDLLSLRITWWLILRAAKSPRLGGIIGHLILDAVFAATAALCMLAYVAWVDSGGRRFLLTFGEIVIAGQLEKVHVFAIILGLTSSIPSILYGLLGGATLAVWVLPTRLHPIVRHAVYLASTDSKPLLGQLGSVCGAIGGVLTAVAAFVKSMNDTTAL